MSERQQTFGCGIEDIQYDHLLELPELEGIRKEQIKHGEKLFEAGNVFAVKETKEPVGVGGSEISGYCDRETSINAEGAYRLYIKLDEERKIISGGFNCNCRFGAGGHFTE